MSAIDSDHIRSALKTKLGCEEVSSDHYRYILRDQKGTILASTKISHGPKHPISDSLLTKMARQMRLGTKANFVAMVNCTLKKEDCLTIILAISGQP
jgi:hypothetical protein